MKNHIKIFIAIFALGFAYQTKAQDKFETKNADAIYENIVHEFIINEDSSSIYNYSHQLRYLTYQSFQRQHGESFIVYDPNFQKLKIRKSETTMADGITKVESPANAYNEVLPRFAAHAAPYMHYKEMVVTHVGLEKNCLVDFSYSLESKKDFMPGIQGRVFLRNERPIKNMEVRVVVPKGRDISYLLLNAKQEPEVKDMAKWTVYKWVFQNIPMIEEEHNQPYLGEFVPTLFVSTASNEEVEAYFSKNYTKLIEPSDAIKSKTNELIKNKESNLDKIKALKKYVANNVGETYVSPELVAYKTYCAKNIYKNNVGTQLDKAILLASMAKAAGIKAEPVYATTYSNYKTDAALLEQFRNTYVYFIDEDLFIDPSSKEHKFIPNSLKGKAYFSLANPKEVKEIEKLTDNSISFDASLKINNDLKTSGTAEYEANGYFKYELSKDCLKKDLKAFFSTSTFKVGENIETTVFNRDKANEVNIEFIEGELKEEAEGLYYIQLPGATKIANKFHLGLGSDYRQTPLKIGMPYEEEYSFTIELPDNLRVVSVGKSETSLKYTIGEVECSIVTKGNKLIVKRALSFKKNIIEPVDYKEYTDIIAAWTQNKYTKIYLKKK